MRQVNEVSRPPAPCAAATLALSGAEPRSQPPRDDTWDRDLEDSEKLRHQLEQAQHGLVVAKHVVGLVSRSSDLNLVAEVAVELHFSEGERFGLAAAPLLERLEVAMADGELPAQAFKTLHAAFGSEGVFDEGDLADVLARARAREPVPPLDDSNEDSTVF